MNLPNKEAVPIRAEPNVTINLTIGDNTEVREPTKKSDCEG